MSERIKELAELAGLAEAADVRGGYIYPAGMEKFVRLIVQECLHNMQNCDGDLDFAIWKTKKDFGVEL